MENASKALLMAGGILVFILIVSVFMLMYQSASELPKTQEQIKEAKELANFNKQYEVYERDNLKGTDVTSVVNMAMSYNQQNPDLEQINVEITLKEDLTEVIEEYKYNNDTGKIEKTKQKINKKMDANTRFDLDNTSLKDIVHFAEYENADRFYTDSTGNEVYKEPDNRMHYYIKNNIFATFKRMKFECTKIDYNTDGRVSKIYFEQT